MAFPTPWRRRFTAISILTASLAVLSPPVAMACDASPDRVEHAMQDGLSDLTRAEALLQEALNGDGATERNDKICGFLNGSAESFRSARRHFSACVALVDETLSDCPGASWDGVSANPALCETRLAEIEARLKAIPDEIARYCAE
jgi:hypothetical protein